MQITKSIRNDTKTTANRYRKWRIFRRRLENAKRLIVSSVDAISEEQDTEITYYYGQELSDRFMSIEDHKTNFRSLQKGK